MINGFAQLRSEDMQNPITMPEPSSYNGDAYRHLVANGAESDAAKTIIWLRKELAEAHRQLDQTRSQSLKEAEDLADAIADERDALVHSSSLCINNLRDEIAVLKQEIERWKQPSQAASIAHHMAMERVIELERERDDLKDSISALKCHLASKGPCGLEDLRFEAAVEQAKESERAKDKAHALLEECKGYVPQELEDSINVALAG